MAILDFSWLGYFMGVFGFFFISVVIYAVLSKTELLGDNKPVNLFVAFVFAIIFITFSPGVEYVGAIVPWFVILFIVLFMLMVLVALSQKEVDKFMKPWVAWVFVAILVIIFLIAAIRVFNPVLGPYLPGSSQSGGDPTLLRFTNFIYSERFLGAALLLIVAAVASWVLTKK